MRSQTGQFRWHASCCGRCLSRVSRPLNLVNRKTNLSILSIVLQFYNYTVNKTVNAPKSTKSDILVRVAVMFVGVENVIIVVNNKTLYLVTD